MSHALPSAQAMGDSTEVIGVQDSSMILSSPGVPWEVVRGESF